MKCSICKAEIKPVGDWKYGKNAEPIKHGRCCEMCNIAVVIPTRIRQLQESKNNARNDENDKNN